MSVLTEEFGAAPKYLEADKLGMICLKLQNRVVFHSKL